MWLPWFFAFGAGLIFDWCGDSTRIKRAPGVIAQQSLRFMKVGFFAFFAGLIQNALAVAHVQDFIGQTPLLRGSIGPSNRCGGVGSASQ